MFRSFATFAILGASAVSGLSLAPLASPRGCGSHLATERVEAAEAHFSANKVVASSSMSFASSAAKKAAGEVEVFFHVISKDNTTEGGNVP
jgi:hypothetical protein